MAGIICDDTRPLHVEKRNQDSWFPNAGDSKDELIDLDNYDADLVLCVSGSKLVKSGFVGSNCSGKSVIFVNAGGEAIREERNFSINVLADSFFLGGDVLRTDESITDGGDIPLVYKSARYGNFCYYFNKLSPGNYLVDFHFSEIVNTNGPKGIRVFDVFIQEEKVLSELDIYSIVGANRPLQVVDVRVSVESDGEIHIRFKGVSGSPIVSAIFIRLAEEVQASEMKEEHLICHNCGAEIEISPTQNKHMRMKLTAKYERKIEEQRTQCQLKADECYEAWMSLTAANEQLENARVELDNRFFRNMCLDQAMEKQAVQLKAVSSQYENDKRRWIAAIDNLERKIKTLRQEQSVISHEAHRCTYSISELNNMVSAVQALVAQCDDLKFEFIREQAMRKKFYNQLQEAKGNIRVFCRCRPLSNEELSAGYTTVVDFSAAKDGELGIVTSGSTKKNFKFDRVFTPKDDQVDVFADASPVIVSVLDGYNVCIFAYGQTGTGKSFTMEGTKQNKGVNYRTLEQLFKTAEERKETFGYNISVSMLEVYNEQIRDLFATTPASKKLEIRQAFEGDHHVPGIVEATTENMEEVLDVLLAGSNARAVASNNVNEYSSRSHCMLCISVRAKNLINGECTKSKLWLVDLAGSERLAKTEVQGERLKEAQNINRSLSALGDVISALQTKSSHIPYRNSKLTHLLQDSLGGDSKTLMFVQISPSERDLGETLSSLNFATRVRGVELGPARKQVDVGELQKLKTMLDKAKQELKSRDDAMRRMEENFHNLEGKAKIKDQMGKNQLEKVIELEDQLALKTERYRQVEKQFLQQSEAMKKKEELCLNLQQKVMELEIKMKEQGEQAESKTLQLKVNELENKLKKRTQEFELHSSVLHRKIDVLEEKLRHPEQTEIVPILSSNEKSGATSNERKVSGVLVCDIGTPTIRSLNSINRTTNKCSSLLKGTDSLCELRRKREIQSKGRENNTLLSASLLEKKILPAEPNKSRHIDPSKALSRITRNATPESIAQRTFSKNTKNKQQVPGVKESNRLKIWSR